MTAIWPNDTLVRTLRDPGLVTGLTAREWTELLRRARSSMLLGKLARLVRSAGLTEGLPEAARRVLSEADIVTEENARMLRWESRRIERALVGTAIRPVLLKGGAYIVAGLRAGEGRLASDLDILVPQKDLREVEACLKAAGWQAAGKTDYDERYYREWMHELPPMRHENRYTTVDVHHTILPPIGRLHPDVTALFASAKSLDDDRGATLAPTDMLLHCAVHLFQDSDLAFRLRDLLDLHELMEEFAVVDDFWQSLATRAALHGLERPAWYTLYFARKAFGTNVPDSAMAALSGGQPGSLILNLMEALITRALPPDDELRPVAGAGLARWLLFVRSHWLRMPPLMLARHLTVKFFRRISTKPTGISSQ